MKIENIKHAQSLIDRRRDLKSVLDRIDAGEALTLTIGQGGNATGIVLTPSFEAMLRNRIAGDMADGILSIDRELRELGVVDGSAPALPSGARPAQPILSSDAAVPAELDGKVR